MTHYYDIEAIRARLGATDVPTDVCTAYLQLLTNLNALSILMVPSVDLREELGQAELESLLKKHQQRRHALEAKFPELALMAAPSFTPGKSH